MIQVHLAKTLKCNNQLIIADQVKVIEISKSQGTNFYNKFGLKNKIGYFTIKKPRDDRFSNVNYMQVG